MRTEVIAHNEVELVSLKLAKQHLKLDESYEEEDVLIEVAMASAISQAENFTERKISSQTTVVYTKSKLSFLAENGSYVDVVEKVEIQEAGVDSVLLPETAFKQIKRGAETYEVVLSNVPDLTENQEYAIYIKQGFDSETLPKPILSAILLLISDAYEKREDRNQGNNTASINLLRPYRKWQ